MSIAVENKAKGFIWRGGPTCDYGEVNGGISKSYAPLIEDWQPGRFYK